MAVKWEIRCTPPGGAAATRFVKDWGVVSLALEYGTQEADKLTASISQSFDDAEVFPFGASVDLLRDGVRVFAGRIVRAPRAGENAGESITYEAEGPWWWLDQYTFEQLWRLPNGYDPTGGLLLVESPLTRVLLGKDIENAKMSAGAVIREVFAFLEAKVSAPVVLGDVELDALQIPAEEARDVTCGEVIRRVLRWSPDVSTVWDLATPVPTVHFRKRASTAAVNFAAGDVEGIPSLTPRYDLRPSCVVIRYERLNVFNNGTSTETLPEVLTRKWPAAGSVYAPDALRMNVQLEGSSKTQLVQRVVTASIDVQSLDWWKKKIPALKDALLLGTTLDVATATVVTAESEDPDPTVPAGTVYGNELLDGAITPWSGKKMAPAVASVVAKVKVRDPDTGEVTERRELHKVNLRSTNAGTGSYTTVTDSREAEPIPEGLAQRYFEALSVLQYDGEIRLHDAEWDGRILIGAPLNLTGFARLEWATMRAGVYRQSVNVLSGTVTLSVGPAKHLGVDDWIQLSRPQRGKAFETGKIGTQRATGRVSGDKPTELGRNHPRTDTTSTTLTAPAAKLDWTVTPMSPTEFKVRTGHVNGVASNTDPQFTASVKTWVYAEVTFAGPSGPEILQPGYGVVINTTTDEASLKKQSDRVRRILIAIVTPGTAPANCTAEQFLQGGIYISRPLEIDEFEVRSIGAGDGLGWQSEAGRVIATYNETDSHVEYQLNADTGGLPGDGVVRIGVRVNVLYDYEFDESVGDVDVVRLSGTLINAERISGLPSDPMWSNYQTGPEFDLKITTVDTSDGTTSPPTTDVTEPSGGETVVFAPAPWDSLGTFGRMVFPLAEITTAGGVITSIRRMHVGTIEINARPLVRFAQTQTAG